MHKQVQGTQRNEYDNNKGTRILFLLTKTKNGPFPHYRTCHHPTNIYKSHFFTNRKSDSEADIIIHIFLPFSPVHTTDTSVHKKNFHFISLVSCHHLIPWSLLWVYLFLCEIHRSYAILPLIVVLCVPYHRKIGGRFKLLRGIWRTYYYATTSVEHTSV